MQAFTLAEVLITLAIIGVVAAMTIPTLTASYRKTVAETRLQKFYSAINQAVILSEIDNGDKKEWDPMPNDTSIEDWYDKYLGKYLKITKKEILPGAYARIVAYFIDGSACSMGSQGITFYVNSRDFGNSTQKPGVNAFAFFFAPAGTAPTFKYHYDKGVEPYAWGWNGTKEGLTAGSNIGGVHYSCNSGITGNNTAYCTKLIQLNGWKIPDDYSFKF